MPPCPNTSGYALIKFGQSVLFVTSGEVMVPELAFQHV